MEFQFVSQPDYTGPLVKYLGGADISWLVGWFVAAIVYLVLARGVLDNDRRNRQAARLISGEKARLT